MGRQIKGLLYFFITEIRYSLMIFWTILLGILVVSLAIAYFLTGIDDEEVFFTFSLTGPIYVYCAIRGFLAVKEWIPFSIKIGATRKNLFVGIGMFFFLMALLMAIAASVLQEIVGAFSSLIGIDLFYFLHFSYFMDDTWYTRIVIDISIMIFLFTLMFIIGVLFHKYGMAVAGSVLGVIAIVLLVGIAQGWIFDFIIELFTNVELTLFYQVLGIGIVIYCISFVFLRRITTVKVK
ncbi:hypothetical protein [Virgibacillus ainsalahensis]